MISTATKHYVAAIRGINAAVSDPETATQDSTLMAIIMAAMFEVLVVPRLSGMENCAKHLNGAVAIALLKLEKERLTDMTHKLLTTLVQSAIISKYQRHVMECKRLLTSHFVGWQTAGLLTYTYHQILPN